MSTTPTTGSVMEIPALLETRKTDSGEWVIKFEGCETKRTRKDYQYLVVHVSYFPYKWDSKLGRSVEVPGAKPKLIIDKGTMQYKYVEAYLRKCDTRAAASYTRTFVLERRGEGFDIRPGTDGRKGEKYRIHFEDGGTTIVWALYGYDDAVRKAQRLYSRPVADIVSVGR
jgi:hypothetical protein